MAARLAPVNWTFLAGFTGLSMIVGLLAGVDPKFAIVASVAVGFVLIVVADLTAGLALFGFFSFLELLGQSSVVSVGKLGGALLALGWIAFVLTREDAKSDFLAVHPGMSMAMGMFLGWVLLSAIWAESSGHVVGSFTRYLLNVVLFLIVFTAVRNRRQATLVISGFLAGAAAAAVYGQFLSPETSSVYGGRLTGAGLDPNELASVLVAGLALSVGLAVSLKGKPGLRLAAFGAGTLCLFTALFTGSRGGLVALGLMLIAAIVFGGRWRGRVAVAGIAVAIVSAFYIFALAPPDIRDHILKSSAGEKKVPEYRTTLWQIGERMVRANPILGVGADNFQTSSRHYLIQPGVVYHSEVIIETPNVAHNTYLQTAAELGIVGFLLFASIIVFSLASCLRAARNFARRNDIRSEALARGVAIAMVGVLAADFFISQMYNKQLWLLLGIGPAMLAISKRSDAELETR
jgi:putative inorganic carbon (HCO3(-)) transporter